MPLREGYWKEYYANNKEKFNKNYEKKYSFTLTIDGRVYVFQHRKDIQNFFTIEKVKTKDIKHHTDWIKTY